MTEGGSGGLRVVMAGSQEWLEAERKTYEMIQKLIVSPDPAMALKGRFARDVAMPLANWIRAEMLRLPCDCKEREAALSASTVCMSSVMGNVIGSEFTAKLVFLVGRARRSQELTEIMAAEFACAMADAVAHTVPALEEGLERDGP
jgi:hypothetical protein